MKRNRLGNQLDNALARCPDGNDAVQFRHVGVPAFACPMNDDSVCHFTSCMGRLSYLHRHSVRRCGRFEITKEVKLDGLLGTFELDDDL